MQLAKLGFGLLAVLGLMAFSAVAQDQATPTKPVIKRVPIRYTNPTSGREMFQSYCAPCHGMVGEGDGPAAPALKVAPTNLTKLTVANDGKFPAYKVQNTIAGSETTAAHGSKDMPIWGRVFSSIGRTSTETDLRIHNLTEYVKSIQQK